jgi:hypothetical protein
MFEMILWDLGHFSYFSLVFSKMNLKIKKIDPHQIFFWNPEIESKQSLSMKIRSDVIGCNF